MILCPVGISITLWLSIHHAQLEQKTISARFMQPHDQAPHCRISVQIDRLTSLTVCINIAIPGPSLPGCLEWPLGIHPLVSLWQQHTAHP